VSDFQLSLQTHQPATLTLTSDDINALIVNNPSFKKGNIKAYVMLKDDTAQVTCSLPTDTVTPGFLAGRYLNVDTTFTLQFDNSQKNFIFTPSSFIFGGTDYMKGTYGASAQNIVTNFNAGFNRKLHEDPKSNATLNQLSNATIKDGQLVLESK
jgi:hypothetical protein